MAVTAQSILSQALVGENPYDQARRILDHLDRAGWTIERKPRIPEPGWGEKVIAHTALDRRRREYVRFFEVETPYPHSTQFWYPRGVSSGAQKWDDLIDPARI